MTPRRTTCDTSVVVAALAPWHPLHAPARASLRAAVALPAHVVLETFSVLTRMPAAQRISPEVAGGALSRLPHDTVGLSGEAQRDLVIALSRRKIGGGAVYDALVGMTARHHDLTLVSADHRARRIYDLLDVPVSML